VRNERIGAASRSSARDPVPAWLHVPVRPRSILWVYQRAARVWLTAAGLALLLPTSTRLGIWLPLHLALAGAASVAISGAMQNFALTLTATPAPPLPLVWAQFGLANLGAGLVAVGYPDHLDLFVAAGGACFVGAMAILGWIVMRAWRRALNKRHPFPVAMYGAAVGAVLLGGTLGALVGSGAVRDPEVWLGLRQAHLTLNVLGFVSLTIVGTLVTLLPTVLRIRIPPWHGPVVGWALCVGVVLVATGLGLRLEPVAAVGGIGVVLGTMGTAWLAVAAMRTPRTWPVPIAGKHFVAGVAWFVGGAMGLAVALARGLDAFAAYREPYLIAFVGGWIVQVLLGAWTYLLPMARPGHPDERRRQLSVAELGGTLQLVALNGGLLLLLAGALDRGPQALVPVGTGLALGGGAVALAKAWAFPLLAKAQVLTPRLRRIWGV
jgi:nitrite reductase (NO-forming)